MKITLARVKKLGACQDSIRWAESEGLKSSGLLAALLKINSVNPSWANWLFTRLMTVRQRRQIAIFAAEQVLPIFDAKFPNDNRVRDAIKAAKAVLRHDTKENREAAYAAADAAYAAYAAYAAADAAYAAYAAAYAAADAAYAASAADAAAYAACAAARAANAAAYAARAAAYAACAAAYAAARKEMQEKIIRKAVKILELKKK